MKGEGVLRIRNRGEERGPSRGEEGISLTGRRVDYLPKEKGVVSGKGEGSSLEGEVKHEQCKKRKRKKRGERDFVLMGEDHLS